MKRNQFDSFTNAYINTLDVLTNYGLETSPRGRASKEIIGYQYILTNPRNRILYNKTRDINIFYCIGNFLWVMAQSNDVDFISYYNPKGPMFSDDGKILRGAYGKRIFDFDGVNQYHQCIKELKTDPDSRRAIIHIHMAQHDWAGSIDTPCTSDFQLLIRDGKLHMINHMRSQSSAMVMPYDVFLMTMLQEFMARELDVELGDFHHYSGSLHYYLEEEKFVDSILDEVRPSGAIKKPMEVMPKTSIMELRKLLRFEKDIRENYYLSVWDDKWFKKLRDLNLNTYWEDIGYLLIAYAMIVDGDKPMEIFDVISENVYDESLRHMAFQYIEEHVNE